MFATLGRVLVFGEVACRRSRCASGHDATAMEPDDLGLGDRSAIGAGYMVPLDVVTVTPFVSYSISLANSALTGTSEGDDLLQSTLYGGWGGGVEVLLRRDGITPCDAGRRRAAARRGLARPVRAGRR